MLTGFFPRDRRFTSGKSFGLGGLGGFHVGKILQLFQEREVVDRDQNRHVLPMTLQNDAFLADRHAFQGVGKIATGLAGIQMSHAQIP